MFGLGAGELFLILVVALIVFGPEKIPEIARWLGKTSAEMKRMSDAVRREFYNGIYVPPPEPTPEERRKTPSLVASTPNQSSPETPPLTGSSIHAAGASENQNNTTDGETTNNPPDLAS